MALHRKELSHSSWRRFKGLKVFSGIHRSEIAFGTAFASWPRLALRLQQRGFLVEALLKNGRPALRTNADFDVLRGLLSTRIKRRSARRVVTLGICLVSLLLLIFTPIASNSRSVERRVATSSNRCREQVLLAALKSDRIPKFLEVTEVFKTGRVQSGIITCGENRYSFTLDAAKSRRVLKLQKLDP
jgi:hypothetical protein